MKHEHIGPFIEAARAVFSQMLDCPLSAGAVQAGTRQATADQISGIIGLSGTGTGSVVLSLDREVALRATEAMLGTRPAEVDGDVIDVVGELTNMIAGSAKAKLAQFQLELGLPSVVMGGIHTIRFASTVSPRCVALQCPWGRLYLEVILMEVPAPAL